METILIPQGVNRLIYRTEKRWRLVHLPRILSVRNPFTKKKKKTKTKKNLQKSSKNFKLSMQFLLVQRRISLKQIWLSMRLLAVLGSQGTVANSTAAILFRAVDCRQCASLLRITSVSLAGIIMIIRSSSLSAP